jgi:Major Facilitator Superfamily
LSLVVVMCVLAALGHLPVWTLAVTAIAVGCAGTFVDVAAQSALPRLVAAGKLPRANAALQPTQTFLAQLVGPALGGYAIALGSGLGCRPDLGRLAVSAAVNNLACAMCLTLLPLRAVAPGPLGLSAPGYGLRLTCLAVGSIIAGPLTGRAVKRIGERRLMRWGGPLLGLCFLTLAVPGVPVVATGLLAYGLVSIVWNVVVVIYRQSTIPVELFGRVNAAYRWITWGVIPLGALLSGALATTVGMTAMFLIAGALPLIAGAVLPVGRGRGRAAALSEGSAEAEPAVTPTTAQATRD